MTPLGGSEQATLRYGMHATGYGTHAKGPDLQKCLKSATYGRLATQSSSPGHLLDHSPDTIS